MAQETKIVNSWSLMAFARSHGKMQRGSFVNKDTGEEFSSCIFTDPDDKDSLTFVAFSRKLGELSGADIKRMKDELQVVELDSGSYILCKQGEGGWEDIDLGI